MLINSKLPWNHPIFHGETEIIWDFGTSNGAFPLSPNTLIQIDQAVDRLIKDGDAQPVKMVFFDDEIRDTAINDIMQQLASDGWSKANNAGLYAGVSGSEVNEAAIKAIRRLTGKKVAAPRTQFFGRTYGSLSLSNGPMPHHRRGFEPFLDWTIQFSDPDELLGRDDIGGIMMTPAFIHRTAEPLDHEWMKRLAKVVRDQDLLLAVDEIQTGGYRSGTLPYFPQAFRGTGLVPNIMTFGKGIAGGYPMGIGIFDAITLKAWEHGMHFATYGGTNIRAWGAALMYHRLMVEKLADRVAKAKNAILEYSSKAHNFSLITQCCHVYILDMDVEDLEQFLYKCYDQGLFILPVNLDGTGEPDKRIRFVPRMDISASDTLAALSLLDYLASA